MNLGDKVIIKECHKMPELVDREAEVVIVMKEGLSPYPIQVLLTEPIEIQTMFGKAETQGPFPFREDELELANPNKDIPDAFLKE